MWFSLIVVIYTGMNPDVDLRPGTVVDGIVGRGYPSKEQCEWLIAGDQDAVSGPYIGSKDYTYVRTCFEEDPRLGRYTYYHTQRP